MTKQDFNDGLLGFLDASPTPFHATQNMVGMLLNAGFIKLDESDTWELKEGQKYFVTRNDSSVIAFTFAHARAYTIIGAHTDSPNLKLKPNPVIKEHGVVKFGVEPYGGILLAPWFDRDLSLAGRVSFLDENNTIKDALIDVKKAIATIPSLAIHLDREANNTRSINAHTDINPICTCQVDLTEESEAFDFDAFLKEQLVACANINAKELYAHELSFYDTQKASFLGLKDDFIASARIDNLLSCYVGLLSICSVSEDTPMLFIASDHEEVGSGSTSGAAGSFLQNTLKRMFGDYEEFVKVMQSSVLISADNAHAVHPNFSTKHDANHAPKMNEGVVIKVNASQRYASNSRTVSRFMNVASSLGEKTQNFVMRSDMACGSTIGPITAAKLGIDTIDIGVPTLGMHSVRELCGSDDAYSLYKILLGFAH
ncbi:MAG: M18 family aminopeptidase [Helicobacteraceae bacterium CG2_30_36_10]|nr:MAG: M18 family aminopeptidase [Helicobacteraceae bacterium CG2_30_36_10]